MLPQHSRITKQADWHHIHRRGMVTQSKDLVLKKVRNELKRSRFGIIVGTKVSKRATERNLIKRRIRAIIAAHSDKVKDSFDIIFITRPSIKGKKYTELEEQIKYLFTRAKLFI
ncbi:ribonuclease P protein component [Patescibacteria group bacterium]|nr:ribonuclease P protein component [Patescibacteria group bacterium]